MKKASGDGTKWSGKAWGKAWDAEKQTEKARETTRRIRSTGKNRPILGIPKEEETWLGRRDNAEEGKIKGK